MMTANTTKSHRGKLPQYLSESSYGMTLPLKEQQYFPFKLYNMLEHATKSEHSPAVSWVHGGRAFAIHDRDEFLEFMVPLFFNQTKFRSFTRQLNIWGFKRLGNIWRHEHFMRGRPDRLRSITRVEVKGTAKTKSRRTRTTNLRHVHGTSNARCVQPLLTSAALPTESICGILFGVSADLPIASILEETSRSPPSRDLIEHPRAQSPVANQIAQGIIPNGAFQPQAAWRPPPVACQQRVALSSRVSFSEDSQRIFDSSNHSHPPSSVELGRDNNSRAQQPPVNEQDILFVLSGLFDSSHQEKSSPTDDLSSILSLDEVSEDFMSPISF